MTTRHTEDGKTRRAIRAALHGERPAVQVGRAGLTEAVLASAEEALRAREAIKVQIGKGCPLGAREAAEHLAESLGAEVVGVTGRVVLLYRPEEPDVGEGPPAL